MTDTNEAVFDFSDIQNRMAEKKADRELKRQRSLDSSYIKRRGEVLARSKERTKANRPEERLTNSWEHAFEQLPLEEQTRISELNLDCRVALAQAVETIGAIAKGKNTVIPPDDIYRSAADFVAQTGRGNAFPDLSLLANLSSADFEAATADDLTLRTTGRFTKLPGLIFDVLAQHVWQWALANKSDCDAAVYAELEAKFPIPEPSPTPAQPIGYRNSTQSEERVREVTKTFVREQQLIGGITL